MFGCGRSTIEFVKEFLDSLVVEKPVHPEFYFRDGVQPAVLLASRVTRNTIYNMYIDEKIAISQIEDFYICNFKSLSMDKVV